MLEFFEVSTLINPTEVSDIRAKFEHWKQKSPNCIVVKTKKYYPIRTIAIQTVEKSDNTQDFLYHLLVIGFHGSAFPNPTDITLQKIKEIIFETLPLPRKPDFRVHQMRFKLFLVGKYQKEYFALMKRSFSLKHLNMNRELQGNLIRLYNSDTIIIIRNLENYFKKTRLYDRLQSRNQGLQIQITINKGKLKSLLNHNKGNLDLFDRDIRHMLIYPYGIATELYVMYEYLEAILRCGDYYTLETACHLIDTNEKISPKKKQRLKNFLQELNSYPTIEDYLLAVEHGTATVTNKRKTAMDYIRYLSDIRINPLTLKENSDIQRLENPLHLLKEAYSLDIHHNFFNPMKKYKEWYSQI